MRLVLSSLGIVLLWSPILAAPALPPTDEPLVITLHPEKTKLELDEPLKVTARFSNRGKEPITVIKPIPNSEFGVRIIGYKWTITKDKVPLGERLRKFCKDVPAVETSDFLAIQPGQSIDIAEMPADMFELYEYGDYEVRLEYAFQATKLSDRGPNSASKEAIEIIEFMPLRSVLSAPLIVHHEVPKGLRTLRSRIERCRNDLAHAIFGLIALTADRNEALAGRPQPGKSVEEIQRLENQLIEDASRLSKELTTAETEHEVIRATLSARNSLRIVQTP